MNARLFRPIAWTPEALVAAGYTPEDVNRWLVDGPRAVPERARLSVTGRKRTPQPTRRYVWGPDLRFLAGGAK
jgi:hypothetical protein